MREEYQGDVGHKGNGTVGFAEGGELAQGYNVGIGEEGTARKQNDVQDLTIRDPLTNCTNTGVLRDRLEDNEVSKKVTGHWKRRARMQSSGSGDVDILLLDDPGRGGCKREREVGQTGIVAQEDSLEIKKRKNDKENVRIPFSEVEETSRDWSQLYR